MKNTSALSAFAAGARTPEQVLAFHRRNFGDARMEASENGEQPSEKPEGVSDDEWNALGDPGKQALIRERKARADLEAQLAEARKPKPAPPSSNSDAGNQGDGQGVPEGDDLEARIAAAVQAALAPVQDAQAQWQADQLASRVRETVTATAATRFHDVADVMPHLDLTQLTDGSGAPDQAKIAGELDRIASEKPHLVKPTYAPRTPMPGAPFGGGAATPSIDDRVKESLSRMQTAAGVRSGTSA